MNIKTHYSLLSQDNAFVLNISSEVSGTGRAINFLEKSVALLANKKIKISPDQLRKLKEATTDIKSRCELKSPCLFLLMSFIPFTNANKIKKLASQILTFPEREILEDPPVSSETSSINGQVCPDDLAQISPERQLLMQKNKDKKEMVFKSTMLMIEQSEEKFNPLVNIKSTNQIKREYLNSNNNDGVKELYKKLGEPSPLKTIIERYLLSNKAKLTKQNIDLPKIASPTHLSLVNQTDYYKKKYGIKMLVCLCSDLASTIENLRTNNEQDPVGIIVVSSEYEEGHVTPIIVDLQDKDNQIISLDVLGKADTFQIFMRIISIAENLNLKMISSTNRRQVDQYSCRTDALVTLRNSLLWIKNKKAEQTYTGLSNLLIGPHQDLHPECDYTNQVTNRYLKIEGKEKFLVIRDKTKGNQNNFVRQAIEHRIENSQTTTFTYLLVLEKESIIEFLKTRRSESLTESEFQEKWKEIIQASDLDNRGVEVRINEKSKIEIKWKTEIKINTYTFKKGFRNLYRQIKSES